MISFVLWLHNIDLRKMFSLETMVNLHLFSDYAVENLFGAYYAAALVA